jgi:hypothetical protein
LTRSSRLVTLLPMLRRLLLGLVIGLVVGGAIAAALIGLLKITTFEGSGGAWLGYLAAAAAGVATGLVAGKPIWAEGAKTEAGLKAGFGALLGAAALFALRRWAGGWTLDLRPLGVGGSAPIAELPAAALPLVAAVLGAFFELDNTGETRRPPALPPEGRARAALKRIDSRLAARSSNDAEEAEAPREEPRRSRR